MESGSARHAGYGKHPQLRSLPAQVGVSFVRIHLGFRAPRVALGPERLRGQRSHRDLPSLQIFANGPSSNPACRQFMLYSGPDPVRRMPLLALRFSVLLQNHIDKPAAAASSPFRCSTFLRGQLQKQLAALVPVQLLSQIRRAQEDIACLASGESTEPSIHAGVHSTRSCEVWQPLAARRGSCSVQEAACRVGSNPVRSELFSGE